VNTKRIIRTAKATKLDRIGSFPNLAVMKIVRASILSLTLISTLIARAQYVDGIQAIVADTPVTYYEVSELSRPAIESMARQSTGREEELRKQISEVMSNNLDHLVHNRLILEEFKTYNVPETILDKDVDKNIQERIQKEFYGDRTKMIKTLQAEGMTMEQLRRQTRERFIEMALRQKNIGSELIISPHKVEAYYLAHKDDFKQDDEVRLRVIVLTRSADSAAPDAKKLGNDIVLKLKEGADFKEMARTYSQGQQSRPEGDWGWYKTRELRKEFADVALKLKAGEYSDVIDTPQACYVLKIEERKVSSYKSLGDVRDDIERDLRLQEESRLERQWIAKLKKKTFVKYYQP
jgi:parvulin-like peptidyl-prolyl isomerase